MKHARKGSHSNNLMLLSVAVLCVVSILLFFLLKESTKIEQPQQTPSQQTDSQLVGNRRQVESASVTDTSNKDDTKQRSSETQSQQIVQTGGEMTLVKGILIVNKKHPLPADYNPGEDVAAKQALVRLQKDMQQLGFSVSDQYSGFRNYAYQQALYQSYVNRDGKKQADTYSARPGYSEHQTGLTFDLLNGQGNLLSSSPQDEAAVNWVANHAHEYGFIVRYQAGKEAITGYQAEPWHLRYIGEQARAIFQSGLSLEEYLGVSGGDYIDN